MKITRSVRLLRFGGVLAFDCGIGGVSVVWRYGFAFRTEARFASVGVEIIVDRWQSAEEEAVDIRKGASATRRDASLGAESVKGSEGMVDALGVLEAKGLLG
jgi:hypothetical protein